MNSKYTRIITVVYIVTAVVVLLCEHFHFFPLLYLTKPLLMPALICLWLDERDDTTDLRLKNLAVISLIFSLLGDVFLMVDPDKLFLFGLVAFLIAHLLYIYLFGRVTSWKVAHLTWAVPACFLVGVTMAFLLPVAGDMAVAVAVYGLAISAMFWRSLVVLARPLDSLTPGRWMVFAGAFLFVVSDSLIGWNKFYVAIPHHRIFIMSTYITSQYFIHLGLIWMARTEDIADGTELKKVA